MAFPRTILILHCSLLLLCLNRMAWAEELVTITRYEAPATLVGADDICYTLAGVNIIAELPAEHVTGQYRLEYAQPPDRYGRIPAQFYNAESNSWVQERLVSQGHAYVMPLNEEADVFPELLATEQQARQQKHGLWNSDNALPTLHNGNLHQGKDHYALLEARVRKVAKVRAHTYLNFGADWRRDSTIYIPGKQRKKLEKWLGAPLASLEGKRVRMRGIVYYFNGPAITLEHAAQLEVIGNYK